MPEVKLQVPHSSLKGFELITETLRIFSSNFAAITWIVLLVAVPVEFVKNYYFVPWYTDESFTVTFRRDSLVGILFLSVITPTVIYYLLQKLNGDRSSFVRSFVFGIKKWPKMIVYGFVTNLIIKAGLICLVIPGIVFYIRLVFVQTIATIEGTRERNPIGVSNEMAKGNFWKLLIYYGLTALLVYMICWAFSLSIYWLLEGWIADLLVDLVNDLAVVIFTILTLQIYIVMHSGRNVALNETE